MTAQPARGLPDPDTGSYEVIHLGEEAAVVVPLADFLRLRALERQAAAQESANAQDTAARWPGGPTMTTAWGSCRQDCGGGHAVPGMHARR